MCFRTKHLIRIAACAAWVIIAPSSRAAENFVFVSYSGVQPAEEAAYVKPFLAKAGLELASESGPTVAKIKAMVQSKAVQWDLVDVTEADYINLIKGNLIEEIDYSVFDKQTLDQLDPVDRQKYGVTSIQFALGIAYRTDLKSSDHPKNWAEFWDAKKFPGPRALPTVSYGIPPWEAALLADGVPADKLYPIDFARATASLDKIKPSVRVWFNTTAQALQSLISGEVDYAYLSYSRVFDAKAQGAKVDFDYGQAFLFRDYFVIPKGAPHKDQAMKLLAYASQPAPGAALMKIAPYGVPNKDAIKLLDQAYAAHIVSAPQNRSRLIALPQDFYGEDSGNGQTWEQVSLKTWNLWYGR
jgi:putative spermidine/putrescine transport system substrate-binding protein